MREWFFRFWDLHGDRIVFFFAATILSIIMILIGGYFTGFEDLTNAGKTALIMILGLLVNKARSPNEKFPKDTVNEQVEGK